MISVLSPADVAQRPKVEKIITPGWVKHGYVSVPASRAYWCAQNKPGSGCGPISNEPQSAEGPKGFPTGGPPDGQLAAGGNARFAELDGPLAPDGKPWRATALTQGGVVRFRWWLTAVHRTQKWHYWITKDGWDSSQPLSRDQLELMAELDWSCPNGEGWRCPMPISDTHHFAYLPPRKTGRHVILAVWDVGDTGNAFYQAIDVLIGPAGTVVDDPDDVEDVIG